MLHDASWLFDRDLEAADNAAMAEWDRRAEIERAVTRDELLDEMTMTFTPAQDEALLTAIARGETKDAFLILALLSQARDRIVTRRMNGDVS
jgi:hypothetical protein